MSAKNKAVLILIVLAVFTSLISLSLFLDSRLSPSYGDSVSGAVRKDDAQSGDIVTRGEGEISFSDEFLNYLKTKYPDKEFVLNEDRTLAQVKKNSSYTLFFSEKEDASFVHVGGVYIDENGSATYKDDCLSFALRDDFESSIKAILEDLNIEPEELTCFINTLGGADEDLTLTGEDIAYGRADYEHFVLVKVPQQTDAKEAIEKLQAFVAEHKISGTYAVHGKEKYSFLAKKGSSNGIHKNQ